MSIETLEWQERVLGGIEEDGFRVARPVRAADGRLAVAGWSVWQRAGGEHLPGRWAEICAAAERFHRASAEVPVPGWHLRRSDLFARADRAAWQDGAAGEFTCLPPVARLAGHLRPVHGPDQLIHGDLSGNVLFHPHLPPAIIDLSPYWRPPAFASAVVAVDALVWEGAGRGVLSVLDGHPDPAQHLLRAAIFRIVMDHLCNPQRSSAPPWWPCLMRVVANCATLLSRRSAGAKAVRQMPIRGGHRHNHISHRAARKQQQYSPSVAEPCPRSAATTPPDNEVANTC
jgi:uncharacterized protein (TIGR02569 family)